MTGFKLIPIFSIVSKELKTIIRDPMSLVMLFVLPSMFIVVLSIALQGAFSSEDSGEKIDVLLVNEGGGDLGDKIAHALEKSRRFNVLGEINNQTVTHQMVVDAIHKSDYQVAIEVPRGSDDALLFETDKKIEIFIDPVLSSQFAHAIEGIVRNIVYMAIVGATLEKSRAKNQVLEDTLTAMAGKRASEMIGVSVAESDREFDYDYVTQSTNYAADRGLMVEQKYLTDVEGKFSPSSVQQNVPGWTIFALFWIAQLIAINMVAERQSGAYKRILISPVSMTQYVAGKTIPFVVINLVQAAFMFAIGVYLLPHLGCQRLHMNNLGAIALITVAISIVSNGFGMCMASVSKNETFVASVSAAILIILCIIGGIMVPKFVMPSYMQELSMYVPHGWAMDGYQNVLVKGYDLSQIIPNVAVLLLFGGAFFIVGILRLRQISLSE